MTQTLRLLGLFASAAFLFGQSTRPPRVIFRAEPAYSEEARRAGVNTTIIVKLLVNENGEPRDIQIVRGAGFGLDEMAIRAVESWRFEPGAKEGKPFAEPAHVELHFSVLDKTHHRQTARLQFDLAPGVSRPELIEGQIPSNPDQLGDASLRVRLTVGPDGRPKNFQTFETNNREWTDRVLREMADWRFRPATRAGQPEAVYGLFELTVSQSQAPGNRPTLGRRQVTISPPEPQDSALPAPKPISPPGNALFEGFPRRFICKWEASAGAVAYLLEWDYMHQDAWHAESEGIPGTALEAAATEIALPFAGSQLGRWRVWPVNASGQRGNPSEWRTFRFASIR